MKKNLLYIFADQWRSSAMGITGEDPVLTPNMDNFAQESFAFTNAISTYPLCSPHRASLLTGKYPFACGFWTNCKIGLDESIMLKPQELTISDVLHDNGYCNAYIGKYHLDASELNFSEHPDSGAQEWDAYTPPGERRHHIDFWYSYGAMNDHLNPHYWTDTSQRIYPGKWSVEHETDITIDFLEHRDTDKPFSVFLSWNPPHNPYDQVPEKYRKIYGDKKIAFRDNVPQDLQNDPVFCEKIKDYFAAVSGLDEHFGRLMDYLAETGLDKDTIVVLSADHGDCMGSHNRYGKNIWYEESIKIPLYIRDPEIGSGTSDVLLSSQDHMPTLLNMLGLAIPSTVQGMSFYPLMEGEACKESAYAFICMMPGLPPMVNKFRKAGLESKSYGWRGLRTKTKTYVVNNGLVPNFKQERLLYDNLNDRFQLSPQLLSKEEAFEYDRILAEYLTKLNDPFLL
jgi:arylsulfatase A-like enzyme